MLQEIDRVVVATPDAAAAAQAWIHRVGAREIGGGHVAWLSARRTLLRAGASEVELLEPDGEGVLADELRRRGRAHLFAAGATADDPGAVTSHAASVGATHVAEGHQHWLTIEIEGAPIRFVISPPAERATAGDLDYLYEATVLAANQAGAVDRIAKTFALDPANFSTITSAAFGYTGVLTLFRPGHLHRFEVITPTDMTKTMGRYYGREGCSFYMAFAESHRLLEIERAAKAAGAALTVDRPEGRSESVTADQLWLHPPSLGGMMLGVSRPTMAWTWSGAPERVEAV